MDLGSDGRAGAVRYTPRHRAAVAPRRWPRLLAVMLGMTAAMVVFGLAVGHFTLHWIDY